MVLEVLYFEKISYPMVWRCIHHLHFGTEVAVATLARVHPIRFLLAAIGDVFLVAAVFSVPFCCQPPEAAANGAFWTGGQGQSFWALGRDSYLRS